MIAQSGGIGFALFNRGKAAGIGFSYVISTGNEADLNMADFLDYMVEDDNTHAVMLFCEAVRNGPAFVAALAKARRLGKPVIAIKIGRSDAGTRAIGVAHRVPVRLLHRVPRRVRALRRDRGGGPGRGGGDRRRAADLPAAEGASHRHHHAVRRRRRLDGGHAVAARPGRADRCRPRRRRRCGR